MGQTINRWLQRRGSVDQCRWRTLPGLDLAQPFQNCMILGKYFIFFVPDDNKNSRFIGFLRKWHLRWFLRFIITNLNFSPFLVKGCQNNVPNSRGNYVRAQGQNKPWSTEEIKRIPYRVQYAWDRAVLRYESYVPWQGL